MVNVAIDDDLDRARDVMRPILALYIGGMGSRDKNFYNALVRRYGFEDAADEVQNLYLDGKKEEAAAALPAELIDMTSICGPRDRVKERHRGLPRRRRRHADDHADGLRPRGAPAHRPRAGGAGLSDAASGAAFLLAAFGDPGHVFPAIALGARAGAPRATTVLPAELGPLARARRGARACGFAPAPEYKVFPQRASGR